MRDTVLLPEGGQGCRDRREGANDLMECCGRERVSEGVGVVGEGPGVDDDRGAPAPGAATKKSSSAGSFPPPATSMYPPAPSPVSSGSHANEASIAPIAALTALPPAPPTPKTVMRGLSSVKSGTLRLMVMVVFRSLAIALA